MLLEILGMAAFGAVKAATVGGMADRPTFARAARDVVISPMLEELTFRAGPLAVWPKAPKGITAIPFALIHIPAHPGARPGFTAWRLLETGASGAVYESLYRRHGLKGAVAAHAAHNLAAILVTLMASPAVTPPAPPTPPPQLPPAPNLSGPPGSPVPGSVGRLIAPARAAPIGSVGRPG